MTKRGYLGCRERERERREGHEIEIHKCEKEKRNKEEEGRERGIVMKWKKVRSKMKYSQKKIWQR